MLNISDVRLNWKWLRIAEMLKNSPTQKKKINILPLVKKASSILFFSFQERRRHSQETMWI
jgi:hypothetical protein